MFVERKVRAACSSTSRTSCERRHEQGLLSLAFHPSYRRNHRFYVDYTDRAGTRASSSSGPATGVRVKSTARQLLFVDQPQPNHNGGELQFDSGRLLYVGMGDGGSAGDPGNRAQNMSQRLGKLLGINPLPRACRVADRRARSPQSVALLVRPCERRPLHRRRRTGRLGGDRLPAARQDRDTRELRLAGLRGPRALFGHRARTGRARSADHTLTAMTKATVR